MGECGEFFPKAGGNVPFCLVTNGQIFVPGKYVDTDNLIIPSSVPFCHQRTVIY